MEEYLGDGLYASYDGYQIRLYTQEGNQVFLEPEVYASFVRFAAKFFAPIRTDM